VVVAPGHVEFLWASNIEQVIGLVAVLGGDITDMPPLFFEENEEVKIPLEVFERAETLFKNCMDLSKFKHWVK